MSETAAKPAMLVNARDAAQMLAVSPRKLWAMTFEESPALPHALRASILNLSCQSDEHWG